MYPDLVRNMYFLLNFNGCNPANGYTIPQASLFGLIILLNLHYETTLLAYFYTAGEPIDITDILEALSGFFFIFEAGAKMLSIFCLKRHIHAMFQQMQTVFWNPRKDKNGNDDKEILMLNKFLNRNAIIYITVLIVGMSINVYIPLVSDGEKLICESYRIPGLPYYVLLGLQALTGYTHIVLGIFPFDMMFMILLSCTTMQFKLLNQELQSLFDDSLKSKEEVIIFRKRFKRCIEHYDFLLRYTKTIDDKFSIPLAVSFVTMFSCHTMEMYRLVKADTILLMMRSFLFVTSGVCLLFMMCFCVPAQRLTDEAALVSVASYSSQWYNAPEQSKPLINIMCRGNKVVKMVPCGIIELNLETALAAIRAMVSYAMFLKTMGEYEH